MTAQDVINSTSQDVRTVIQASGQGQTILLDYVDRVQKDCLHSGVYEYLSRAETSFSTTAGTANYTLTPTNIRSVATVYDRTTERLLQPLPDMLPLPIQDPVKARDALRVVTNASLPDFYRFTGTAALYLFPTPLKVVTMEVHYTQQQTTLAAATATLTVPDDGKDMVVAGVNFLASLYLARPDEAKTWAELYQMLKGAPSTLLAVRPAGA